MLVSGPLDASSRAGLRAHPDIELVTDAGLRILDMATVAGPVDEVASDTAATVALLERRAARGEELVRALRHALSSVEDANRQLAPARREEAEANEELERVLARRRAAAHATEEAEAELRRLAPMPVASSVVAVSGGASVHALHPGVGASGAELDDAGRQAVRELRTQLQSVMTSLEAAEVAARHRAEAAESTRRTVEDDLRRAASLQAWRIAEASTLFGTERPGQEGPGEDDPVAWLLALRSHLDDLAVEIDEVRRSAGGGRVDGLADALAIPLGGPKGPSVLVLDLVECELLDVDELCRLLVRVSARRPVACATALRGLWAWAEHAGPATARRVETLDPADLTEHYPIDRARGEERA